MTRSVQYSGICSSTSHLRTTGRRFLREQWLLTQPAARWPTPVPTSPRTTPRRIFSTRPKLADRLATLVRADYLSIAREHCSPDPLDARRRAFSTGDVIVWLRCLRTRVSCQQADGIRFPVLLASASHESVVTCRVVGCNHLSGERSGSRSGRAPRRVVRQPRGDAS